MGRELFAEHRGLLREIDELLPYSLEELCLEGPLEKLNSTEYTQPALFAVSAMSYLSRAHSGSRPDYLAGHSLGEYNALFAGGAFDFLTGLRIVKKRGELMSRASGGAMAAVLGLPSSTVEGLLRDLGALNVDIANYNSPLQTVISGPKDDVKSLRKGLKEAGAKFIPLKVSAAFHSRYMAEAAKEFASFLEQIDFRPLEIPVVANSTAELYESDDIASTLAAQISSPVRWVESVRFLNTFEDAQFEEVGPGRVLTKLCAQILEGQC